MIIVVNNYHVHLVMVCIWVWGFTKLSTCSAHGLPLVFLSRLWLSYCAPVFGSLDAITELHPMDEKMFNDFFIGKWKRFLYVIEAYLIHDFHFVNVVEAFITLNWKAQYKYISPFSSMPLVCINLFFSINFLYYVYKGFSFIVTHTCHFGFQWRVHLPSS